MSGEWNNKPIAEMDTDHIVNTISLLEKRAKTAYETEALAVEDTIDSYRAQAFAEKDWTDFLHSAYYDLVAERDRRPAIDTGLNF